MRCSLMYIGLWLFHSSVLSLAGTEGGVPSKVNTREVPPRHSEETEGPSHPLRERGKEKKMEVGEAHTLRPRCSGLFSDASPKKWVLLVERKVKAEGPCAPFLG